MPMIEITDARVAGFQRAQRMAYDCAEAVAATLEPGVTERKVARRMRRWLEERGVRDWFHQPFAWFGDRTAFRGFHIPLQFFPTGRRLEEGMPYILDCAPVVDGYTADIGYSGCLGDNPVLDLLLDGLDDHRRLVLEGVRSGRTLREVYDDVDRLLARQGFDNRHRRYPFGVIAHRVDEVPTSGPAPVVARFGVNNLRNLSRDVVVGRRQGWSPLWGPTRFSDHVATPGFWAVEPHLGFRGVGAKFEEILVVTDDDAFWLSDDVPHVTRHRSNERGRATPAQSGHSAPTDGVLVGSAP